MRTAREIFSHPLLHPAVQAVGVFVDEDAASIASACADAGLDLAQLHGDGARAAYLALPPSLPVVYVLHADTGGALQTPLPPDAGQRWGCIQKLAHQHLQRCVCQCSDVGTSVWCSSDIEGCPVVSRLQPVKRAVGLEFGPVRQLCRLLTLAASGKGNRSGCWWTG